VCVHDFVRGFVLEAGPIFSPLVLKTVFVFASYLKGNKSSLAIATQEAFPIVGIAGATSVKYLCAGCW